MNGIASLLKVVSKQKKLIQPVTQTPLVKEPSAM